MKMFFTVLLIFAPVCFGHEAYVNDGLERMNQYRERHHAPPLKIDDNLMKKAKQCVDYYSEKGEMDHTCPFKEGAGENLGWETNSEKPPTKRLATVKSIDGWYREYKDYHFDDPTKNGDAVVGHFTQLVWKGSERTGIAAVQNKERKTTYVAVLYEPDGNKKLKGDNKYKFYLENVLQP